MIIAPMIICSREVAQAMETELSLFRQQRFFTELTEARIKQIQQIIPDRRHRKLPLDITL